MATRKIKIAGYNHEEGTEATVLFDGVSVFSGALTASIVSEAAVYATADSEPEYIFEFDFDNDDDTTETEHALSVAVTAGTLRLGIVYISSGNDANLAGYPEANPPVVAIAGDTYYIPSSSNTYVYGDGTDAALPERINCLIDGETPPFQPESGEHGNVPTGVLPDAPTFSGFEFAIRDGSTFTCTLRVPTLLAAYVAP
jgi:hypothetical protein